MLKKFAKLVLAGFIFVNIYGGAFIAAGAAESGKATQTFNVEYLKAVDAAKEALKTLDFKFEEAVIDDKLAQIKGKFNAEKTIHIYIFKISENESKVQVRVGSSISDKTDAQKILDVIAQSLGK